MRVLLAVAAAHKTVGEAVLRRNMDGATAAAEGTVRALRLLASALRFSPFPTLDSSLPIGYYTGSRIWPGG
jgi:hypothetical protein